MKAYINNYESFSCAGNTEDLMNAIYSKNSGIHINSFYMPKNPVGLGAMPDTSFFDALDGVVLKVLENSNLKNFNNTLLIVGSSVGGMQESESHYFRDKDYKNIDPSRHIITVISEHLDKQFSFKGARSISTACTSSANALLLAKRLINVGAYDNVLVVGADALCYTTVCGFHALSVLSSRPCTPFSEEREGMNVAEAVAALLIQSSAKEYGVELAGVGASSDAYHMTHPDPSASGAITSMKNAIEDAGISTSDIAYVNAHGTGTQANDEVEALAVEKLFSDAKNVYVSSTKAITGHTLGAAGALEAIISCEVIKQGKIPPQANLEVQENKNINIATESVKMDVKYVISNSFAFGGNNTSILFGAQS